MINLVKSWNLYKRNRKIWPEGKDGLERITHREMVGGMWDEIGTLQFEFLKSNGLAPEHKLLEVGCGCFRAGRYIIEYLNEDNYFGVDKEKALTDIGREKEVPRSIWDKKNPTIIITDRFNFSRVKPSPDYVIAQSLFTHLTKKDISLCLKNLATICDKQTKFFVTFFETTESLLHIDKSHSGKNFEYTKTQMFELGENHGWQMEYIGEWDHPRNQKMLLYTLN